MIATIGFFMAVGNTYAQTIPDPNWPLDSVVNGSVHSYTIMGDQNYSKSSTFVWTVKGGHLYYDGLATTMVGNGITDTVVGDARNMTKLYVKWDSFVRPVDTGYVYVYEISDDGCQRAVTDPGKYQGMNIKVSAPPRIRFLTDETITCSNMTGVSVDIAIEGMAPYDLIWSYNGDIRNWRIEPADLIDSDMDGKEDNVTIYIDDYIGTTVDVEYSLELLEVSSGGVKGKVQANYPKHTVKAFVQSKGPQIDPSPTEVTAGNQHQYSLSDDGENVDNYLWELYSSDGVLWFERETKEPSVPILFKYGVGDFNLVCYYLDKDGCYSLADTLAISVFGDPTIAFADSSANIISCSALDTEANDSFEFTVDYYGSRAYDFTYAVYDYNNVLLYQKLIEFEMNRAATIVIPNTFINDEIPDVARTWKVVILNSINEENKVVTVIDGNIAGGRDERTITIHPKPIITEDIDFAN